MAEKKNEDLKKKEDPFEEFETEDESPKKKPEKKAPEEEEPKLVKREKSEAAIVNSVAPRRAFVLDKKGAKQKSTPAAIEEAEKGGVELEGDTEFLEYAHGKYHRVSDGRRTHNLGYVNASGVLFPPNFKFRGGHVANAAPEYGVVLNVCPRCKHRQSVEEAVQGECGNMKTRDADGLDTGPCGYSAYEELDSLEIKE